MAAGSTDSSLLSLSAASMADWREKLLVMAWACVGPPQTMRSASATMSAVASPTGTTVTSYLERRPSPMWLAMVWVLPYIDS